MARRRSETALDSVIGGEDALQTERALASIAGLDRPLDRPTRLQILAQQVVQRREHEACICARAAILRGFVTAHEGPYPRTSRLVQGCIPGRFGIDVKGSAHRPHASVEVA